MKPDALKYYHVRFFCGSDVQHDYLITAANDLMALARGLSAADRHNWVEQPEMRIEIELA